MDTLRRMTRLLPLLLIGAACAAPPFEMPEGPWVVNEPPAALANGKLVVLVSGDEEYRSEEALPQLARILAARHGFRCVTLFAIDPATGVIDPDRRDHIPGLELLDDADLMVIATRFRDLPDDQMAHVAAYLESGRPVVGLRTATHAFALRDESPWAAAYNWNSQEPGHEGGFGRQVLGETWVAHHGQHGVQGTRGVLETTALAHPVIRGVRERSIFVPTDVYRVNLPLPDGCKALVLGEVTASLERDSPAVEGQVNDPMMPVAWVRTREPDSGLPERVFATTMGAASDLADDSLRRLLVNACHWAVGLEVPREADVRLVGDFEPSPYAFGGAKPGVRPSELAYDTSADG